MTHALLILFALAAAPAPQTATFQRVTKDQVLFQTKVPSAGRWKFCLKGTKPAKDRFVFHALVDRAGVTHRVDYVTAAPPDATNISACATQLKDEQPLAAGELVRVVSIWDTAGPVTLTLTSELLPP